MKSIKWFLGICALIFLTLGFAACGKTYELRAPDNCDVQIGTYYSLPVVIASNGEGEVYASVSVSHSDGTAVEIEYNRIHIAKAGTYIVRYYIESSSKIIAEDIQILTVVDNSEPLYELKDFKATARIGETYVLPEMEITDILGNKLEPTIEVSTDIDFKDETKKVSVDEQERTFTIDVIAKHYIRITATNSLGETVFKTIEVYVRKIGEMDAFETEASLKYWIAERATLAFNSDEQFIKSGESSLHVTASATNASSQPIVELQNINQDISDMKSFDFWIYNNGKEIITLQTLNGGGDAVMGYAYPQMWTQVYLTQTELATLKGWGSWANGYDLSNMEWFSFMFSTENGSALDVYIDEIFVSYEDKPVSYSNIVKVNQGESHICVSPTVKGVENYTVSYDVYNVDTNKTIRLSSDNSFVADGANYRVYASIATAEGKAWQVSYPIQYYTEADFLDWDNKTFEEGMVYGITGVNTEIPVVVSYAEEGLTAPIMSGEKMVKVAFADVNSEIIFSGSNLTIGATVTFDIYLAYNVENERASYHMTHSSGEEYGYGVDPDIKGISGVTAIWTNVWNTFTMDVITLGECSFDIRLPMNDAADFDLYTIYIDNVKVSVESTEGLDYANRTFEDGEAYGFSIVSSAEKGVAIKYTDEGLAVPLNGGEYCTKFVLSGAGPEIAFIGDNLTVGSTVTFQIYFAYDTAAEGADYSMTHPSGKEYGYGVDPNLYGVDGENAIWTNVWNTFTIIVTNEGSVSFKIAIPQADWNDYGLYTIYIDNVIVTLVE